MQEKWVYGYSPTESGLQFHPIRRLTDDEYDAAGQAVKVILDVLTGPTSFSELTRNDLSRTVDDLNQRLARKDELRKVEVWGPELEYRIVAVSAALRMHEEFVTAIIRKRNDPAALASAKTAFKATYDRSQAYRIIYSLRNALVHGSKGLTTLSARATLNADETTSAIVSINLSREGFGKSDAKAPVRAEVRGMTDNPELIALSHVALDELAAMRVELESLLYPDAPAASALLLSYVKEVNAAGVSGPHFHAHDPGEPFSNMTNIGMNESIFNHVVSFGQFERRSNADPARQVVDPASHSAGT